ncbi:hypothetical protein AB0B45_02345 [Nonomuraea sp. NPDC049152]|uniref:hypothetical protein n=1 Tax=Nonomuraea sp. NPDC049152 TaxID=3154350 RepID=UPI0033F0D81A
MPDQWQVTDVRDSADRSGRIEAWQMTLTNQTDGVSMTVWLPKMAIENTAVAYGLTSAEEVLDVILHQSVLPIYEPDVGEREPGPWGVTGEEARAAVLEQVERCKRDHAVVAAAVPKARTAAARAAADVLAPLRSHTQIDPVKAATARLQYQRAAMRAGA